METIWIGGSYPGATPARVKYQPRAQTTTARMTVMQFLIDNPGSKCATIIDKLKMPRTTAKHVLHTLRLAGKIICDPDHRYSPI